MIPLTNIIRAETTLREFIETDHVNDNALNIVYKILIEDDLEMVSPTFGYMWNHKLLIWEGMPDSRLKVQYVNEDNMMLQVFRNTETYYKNLINDTTTASNATTTTSSGAAIKRHRRRSEPLPNRNRQRLSQTTTLGTSGINDTVDDAEDDAEDDVVEIDSEKKRLIKYLNAANKAYNDINSKKKLHDMYSFLLVDVPLVSVFKEQKLNRSHDLLPIRNGKTLDLKTGAVRDRTRADCFSFECPVTYIPSTEWTDDDRSVNGRFVDPIFMNDPAYIAYQQIKMGSYLSGRNTRDIDINHGCGKNGKSAIINTLKIILKDFYGCIGKNVIVYDKTQNRSKGNAGQHTSHLMPIDGKRLIVTNELEPNDVIDCEMVKKIASADTIEGVRESYGRTTTTIEPFCKLVVTSNNIPKFDVTDTAIKERLTFHPFKSRFLTDEAMKKNREEGDYDPTKYVYHKADGHLMDLFKQEGSRCIDILFSWLVEGCIKFYAIYPKDIEKPDIVKQYMLDKMGDNDEIGQWMAQCCDVIDHDTWLALPGLREQKLWRTQAKVLYDNYINWAIENCSGAKQTTIHVFYKRLDISTTRAMKPKNPVHYDRIRLASPCTLLQEPDSDEYLHFPDDTQIIDF